MLYESHTHLHEVLVNMLGPLSANDATLPEISMEGTTIFLYKHLQTGGSPRLFQEV